MPTTSLSQWAFHNFGPLTTTYTAPTSCFTEFPRNIELATNFEDENNSTSLAIIAGTCASATNLATVGDCLPSGEEIDKFYATYDTQNPLAGRTINYFSPGLICPSGYATVGVATKADGGSITSSGAAFVPTSTLTSGNWDLPVENPVPNVMLQGLNKGETAVLCCPSSYTVEIQGYCWSSVPSYTATVGCGLILPHEDLNYTREALSIFGTTITANIITYIATSPMTERLTQTQTNTGKWVGVAVAPALTLIHNAADVTSVASQSTSSSTSGSARVGGGNSAGVGFTCWTASIAIGVLYLSLL